MFPAPYPRPKVVQSRCGPSSVDGGEDEENAVGKGILGLTGVLGEVSRLGIAQVGGPGCTAFNGVDEACKAVVDVVGKEGEIGGSKMV